MSEWTNYSAFDYITIWLNPPHSDDPPNTDFNQYYHGPMLRAAKAAQKVPVFYAYVIAFETKARSLPKRILDCDQGSPTLCELGADFIRNNRALLVSRYAHQAASIAKIIGRDGKCIFLMEPDFWLVV